MIQLLFSLLAAEVAVVVVLLFKTPLRKLAILGLDRLKRGRGPLMVKTVAATVLLVLSSSVYSMAKIRSRSTEIGSLNPTDQVLMSRHLLEASLMDFVDVRGHLLIKHLMKNLSWGLDSEISFFLRRAGHSNHVREAGAGPPARSDGEKSRMRRRESSCKREE